MIDIPPNTDTARMTISRPGRIASRRSTSAPPKMVTTVLLGGTRQAPFRDAPPNTAIIRLPRARSVPPEAGTGARESAWAGRSSSSGTRSAWVLAA